MGNNMDIRSDKAEIIGKLIMDEYEVWYSVFCIIPKPNMDNYWHNETIVTYKFSHSYHGYKSVKP